MNLLLESLPKTLLIEKKKVTVKTDFKTWMCLNELLIDENTSNEEIVQNILDLFDEENKAFIATNMEEVLDKVAWFLRCGKEEHDSGSKGPVTFSFTYDSDYILSAFQQFYNIDLIHSDMHWWEFIALMNSISGECELKERVRYRSIDLGKIKDPKERARIRAIKKAVALPHKQRIMSDEEIGEAIW